jgi:hypothetical protein
MAPVTAWLVSTLPAATAAGYSGDSIVRGGMITVSGFRQPALSGMSLSTSVRNTYRTAASATLDGALKLPSSCGLVPVKSMTAVLLSRSTVTLTLILAPLSSS